VWGKDEIMMTKKPFYRIKFSFLVSIFLIGLVSDAWCGNTADHSIYRALLKKHVGSGVVDYQGFKQEEDKLDQYLKILDETDIEALASEEQLALYINAYNAYTIKLILNHYPVSSIKDVGGWLKTPWKIRFCRVGGKTLTLDEIEHDILRPRFKDPRVHFAVNCASKSCPPLISEPYEGPILNQQLDSNARNFINNPKENRLEGNTLYVSKIFKWFEDDFKGDVIGFFLTYAGGDLKDRLLARKDHVKIKYLDYDWSLNGRR
jgi:hypothetical protein